MAVGSNNTLLDQLGRSLAAVGGLISSIRPEQWAAPTPCTDWTVRELVGHLVGMNRVFAALLAGEPPPRRAAGGRDDDDLAFAYQESAGALLAAFSRPGALDRSYHGPLGAATGAERLQIRLYDLLAHGWDLAQATGQPARLPDDAAMQALAFARVQLVDSARSGRFGPVRAVSPQAPAIEQLVAFLGRRVESITADSTVTFAAADGTRLTCRRTGAGRPLVCLPGGPMRAAAYLGDLGGLVRRHPAVLLDLRGTGRSAVPADPTSYRCERQVDDVEALRRHFGLDRVDLAGHSAGAAVAIRYAARYPERIGRLVLITPSPRPVGLEVSDVDRRAVADLRRGEPWFAGAYAAFERICAGDATEADWDGITPFTYGRWDAVAQAHHARQTEQQNAGAASHYYAAGAGDVPAVRSALGQLRVPVLIVAGEYDVALPPPRAGQYAALLPRAEIVVQPRAGHYPWLDDPGRFAESVLGFLAR